MAVPSRRTSPAPAGLRNRGNTCFFNATAQCLLSLPALTAHYCRGAFSPRTQPLSLAFQRFILDYQNTATFDPAGLIRACRPKMRLFDGRQQDAHCFFEAFLAGLSDESLLSASAPASASAGSAPRSSKTSTALYDMFGVITRDTVTCASCRFSHPVTSISLSQYLFVAPTIQAAVDAFQSGEDVVDRDHPWTCPGCASTAGAGIRRRIEDTAMYVVVHLNRFLSVERKNEAAVEVSPEVTINGVVYERVGVVCHVGSLHGGHYFAKTRRDGAWYLFNDATVERTGPEVRPSEPYLVFYELKKH